MQIPYRKPGKFASMKADPLVTAAKLEEMKQKLAHLKKIQPGLAAEVARLAELGDFSENAEYQLAKGRLRGTIGAVIKLEHEINQATVIAPSKQTDVVEVGHTVTVEQGGKQRTYQILGSSETRPEDGVISHQSPLGIALLGKEVGGEVTITLANGKKVGYKIISII